MELNINPSDGTMHTMKTQVNIAVIGYGYWGPNLVRNFLETDGGTAAVCCGQDADRLAKARRKHPSLRLTAKVEEVFADPQIQAVAIATPVHTHYPLAKRWEHRHDCQTMHFALSGKPDTKRASAATPGQSVTWRSRRVRRAQSEMG